MPGKEHLLSNCALDMKDEVYYNEKRAKRKGESRMVRHVVMFEFLEQAEGRSRQENARIAKEMLENLVGVIPSLLSAEVKLNAPQADKTNYDLVLITEHVDFEGLQAYIVHPEHVKVGQFMKNVRKSRVCVDYE